MNRLRWILVSCGAALAVAGWAVSSCAIDDEVTWINDPSCTGGCRTGDQANYSCDVDSNCTPAPGCTDWDCSERIPGGTGDDGENAPDGDPGAFSTDGCVPSGGSPDRAAAAPLTVGVRQANLVACPQTSGWFRFDVPSGARFVVELQPQAGGELGFVLYGADGTTPIAAAEMTESGRFGAYAAADSTYLLRVRSRATDPASYSLAVFLFN